MTSRERVLATFEQDAETLVTYELDLLAELERQIRAVHRTMRHIEKLRAPTLRIGPEILKRPANGYARERRRGNDGPRHARCDPARVLCGYAGGHHQNAMPDGDASQARAVVAIDRA
jgi:hypothetical protein